MQELKLFSGGEAIHYEVIKKKYDSLKKKVKDSINLTESEKKNELKKLNNLFKKEKRDLKDNLY